MSLIRIRRDRKGERPGPNRPPALWKLIAGLILAVLLIWYLGRFLVQ